MNKEDIIKELSRHMLDKKQAKTAVEKTIEIMKAALSGGDKVVLSNFGTFKVKESRPISLKNPKTGRDIPVPAKTRVRFKPSENILK
ncbi:MAG: HU family DNA-binding protein [Elusimicrobiota bacterium]|jgi:nucleoid DNA-binding protein|nr:HU family DNA-binding protein [Elusimicrobiota bacterium]